MRMSLGASACLRSQIAYRWPRTVDEALASGIVALYNDSIRTENVLGYTEPLTAEAGAKVTDGIDRALRRGEKHLFGIFIGADLIGMAILTPNALPNCKHMVEWSKGIIHSQYRGAGILRPALHSLGTHCIEQGWEIVTLDVRAESRAHRLWSLCGFREYGRLADYARINDRPQAGAYMFASATDLVRACAEETPPRRRSCGGSSETRESELSVVC